MEHSVLQELKEIPIFEIIINYLSHNEMKRFTIVLFLALLCAPTFAQYATGADYNLSADYKKYNNIKKAGVTGIVVFGATWLVGSSICIASQNRYIDEHWSDQDDLDEYLRLYREAESLPAYKQGQAMSIVGCIGTGVSIFLTAKYGTKAKRIKKASGETLGLMSWDVNPQGLSLSLTF